MKRAVGLSSHGVGIGAFVYLRRIFESLLEEAHIVAQTTDKWDESKFQGARIEDKILLLKGYLPVALVENRKVYTILSKGIHELSEEECLKYFNTVRLGIELILDEKIYLADQADKSKRAKDEIGKVVREIKKK